MCPAMYCGELYSMILTSKNLQSVCGSKVTNIIITAIMLTTAAVFIRHLGTILSALNILFSSRRQSGACDITLFKNSIVRRVR